MEPFTNMRVGQGFQGNERFYGYVPDLIQELSKEIGFKYRFIKSDDFGSPLPNGSWKGQVGMLIRGVSIVKDSFWLYREKQKYTDTTKV